MVKKVLFITLSNIGDCILTLPVLDCLKDIFPHAEITCLAGPRPKEIFQDNPNINRLIVYDKHAKLKNKIELFFRLKKQNFDIVIDLRNSLFGVFLPPRFKPLFFLRIPKDIAHMKDRHLYKLMAHSAQLAGKRSLSVQRNSVHIRPEDEEYVNQIFKENKISEKDRIVIVSAGARSHLKRWAKEKFAQLMPLLIEELGARIILVGDRDDLPINKYIAEHTQYPLIDLTAKTSIGTLASLLKKAKLLITNDSAVLHLGSYLNVPMAAIFGPTSEVKYGPWSDNYRIVKKETFCRPCQEAQCRFKTLECMRLIKVEDVLRQARAMLVARTMPAHGYPESQATIQKENLKRILIVRTDRIGDVLLSTPVIKALRQSYPCAYIAMMVSPYAEDIVEDNPYLDEVIIYDKEGLHRSWQDSVKFALDLKKKRFDLALILHPTNRVHLITFFAGIPKRIGYDRKLGILLTDRIKHVKPLGEKHELEYSLDLARYLGFEPEDKNIFMPIRPESEKWAEGLLQQEGINKSDKLLAIHPGASCPSKIWPNQRFAEVSDRLMEKYGFKTIIISGPKDISLAQNVIKDMHQPAIDLAGRTSVSQLASILKRCQLFISNDSGPVHIASALGVPVISIFGRNQKGLSPKRWGPVGKKDKVLHKEVGCIECLAHNCKKEFACLRAITVDDVIKAADEILKS